jgi:hypothetical protein
VDRQAVAKKKKPTTVVSGWFSGAPPTVEILNLWRDFRKVVDFIDGNWEWLSAIMKEICSSVGLSSSIN